MDMVRPRVVGVASIISNLRCPTPATAPIEKIEVFSAPSNRTLSREDVVSTAAAWYAARRGKVHAVVPTLRKQFGLSALEVVQAIRLANGGAA